MSSSPDNHPKLPKPKRFSREHRLGLVVYGGVSLAIYMNGICQEFYNAVRGRGIYKLIKALTDADIVVDIISGTSAGGINGVLLSYALANSQGEQYISFNKFADVWKNEGDINKLFFDLNDKNCRGAKSSFFNGIDYKSKISKALSDCATKDETKDDWFSDFGELDLFITGTDIQGKIYQVFDSTDCVIDVKDHQAIFHLKYRENGDNDFNVNEVETTNDGKNITCEALAKLCQITSCFPVAFPAVTVKLKPEDNDPDKKLVQWGKLNNRIVPENLPQEDKQKKNPNIDDDLGQGYRLHFVDGGVLDNRPFSYTIKEIYHRAAERPVFRKLFYIDPSPDRFAGNPKYDDMLKPDIVQVVQDSILSMPGYESINNDLELINEHNERVRRYKFLLVDLENILDIEEKDIENNDFYDQQKNVYLRTRLTSLEDKILPLVFLKSEGLKPNNQKENRIKKLEKVANLLAEPFADPEGSSERLALLEDLEDEICNLDVDYTLRRYFFITEYVYKLLDEDYLCEWIKNKKKQEIDRRIKKEQKQNKNKESLNQFIVKAELEKQRIDTILGNLEKSEIGTILDNLQALIQKLNKQRKLIEAVKSSLDKLFLGDGIENYFSKLLDHDHPKQFANKFYRAMLWLHGKFLDTDLDLILNSTLEDLSVKKLTKYLNEKSQKPEFKEPQSCLDVFFEKFPNNKQYLEKLSNSSLLKKLVEETQKELPRPVKGSQQELSIDGEWDTDYYSYIKKKLGYYFYEFEKFDTILYPLDYFAGVPEKQLIETFRISPEDAKLGFSSHKKFKDGNRLDKKLAGDSLRAFGGFLKKSWRANDILWGRLDGLNRIVDALVTEEKIKNFRKFVDRETEEQKKSQDQYLDCLIEEALFLPDSDHRPEDKEYLEGKINELKKKIKNLLPEHSSDEKHLTDKEKFNQLIQDFRDSLVEVGHLIILDKELNETMTASIEEQLNWQQHSQQQRKLSQLSDKSIAVLNWMKYTYLGKSGVRSQMTVHNSSENSDNKNSKDMSSIPKFNRSNLSFDSAITALVVKEVAKKSLYSMSLKQKENFFNEDYKIGLETLEHLPKPERDKIIVKAICIFEDILATWLGTNATRQENKTYRRPLFGNKLRLTFERWIIKLTISVLKIIVPKIL